MNIGTFEAMNENEMMAVSGGVVKAIATVAAKTIHYNYHTSYTRKVNRRGRTTVHYSGRPTGSCVVCRYSSY